VLAGGQPDFKECWFATPTEIPKDLQVQFPEIYAENVWPEGDPAFPALYTDRGRELHLAGLALLRGAALVLGLSPETFTTLCEGGPHIFRMLRYLPLTEAQTVQKPLWGEEHTDFNLLTLLPGGRHFVCGGADCHLHTHALDGGAEVGTDRGHHGTVHAVRAAADGASYASGADDATIRLWPVVAARFE
jgi:hypothetical protein